MPDPRIRTAFYLSPTVDSLWRWSDDGQVLTWPDNSTIAFRGEVEAVLAKLAPGGLPPFGAVALLLAAGREGWMRSAGRELIVGFSQQTSGMRGQAGYLVTARIGQLIAELVAELDRANSLPKEDVAGTKAREALLAEIVFEALAGRGSPADAALVLEGLESGITGEMLRPQLSHEDRLTQFARQVEGMAAGLARVTSETLARRGNTGLDQEIDPAPSDLAPPDAVRQLLAELRQDTELAGLAKLAQHLMAAVSVPRTLHNREELAVGGVSDLTNRGSLDRLLVSELAHDDLTLAVRVAVNEALYLRREAPPAEPPHRRAILIDIGVRMWGLPRMFATSVALALAATNDSSAALEIYRAAGAHAVKVDLTTRTGLDEHLAALSAAAHPGAALGAFMAAIEESSGANLGHTDAMLITHADVLSDPEFISALASVDAPPMYVAAVDRAGGFSLVVLSRAGRKPVREARLDLDAILASCPARRPGAGPLPLVNRQVDPTFPAILYLDDFPLYLPYVVEPSRAAASAAHGLVGATHDGRLLHWSSDHVGARQLTSLLPGGHVQCVFIDDLQKLAGVLITRRRRSIATLVTADLQTGRCRQAELVDCPGVAAGAFARQGMLYLVYPDQVRAFAIPDGTPTASLTLAPGMQWSRDRFFRTPDSHWSLAYDGSTELKLDRIPVIAPDVVGLVDVAGQETPWAIYRHRAHDLSDPKKLYPIDKPVARIIGVSWDRRWVAFESQAKPFVFDIEKKTTTPSANPQEDLLFPLIHRSTRQAVHPRNRFKSIFVDSRSRLALGTKSNNTFVIDASDRRLALMEHGNDFSTVRLIQAFHETARRPGILFKMSVATWNDGSKAFLDSRGILHLKSSDQAVPELSLAMSNVWLAAWSSDGKMTGPKYFLGPAFDDTGQDARQAAPHHFMKIIDQFIARLR